MLNRNFYRDRDFFMHLLEMELKRSLRYQSFTSVLLVEIPIKNVDLRKNGAFLEKVVASLSSQIRETDLIGTTRENTITVILPNCDKRSTSEVEHRVICWMSHYFGSDANGGGVSRVGSACFPTHATDSEHLLSAAGETLEPPRRESQAQPGLNPERLS